MEDGAADIARRVDQVRVAIGDGGPGTEFVRLILESAGWRISAGSAADNRRRSAILIGGKIVGRDFRLRLPCGRGDPHRAA